MIHPCIIENFTVYLWDGLFFVLHDYGSQFLLQLGYVCYIDITYTLGVWSYIVYCSVLYITYTYILWGLPLDAPAVLHPICKWHPMNFWLPVFPLKQRFVFSRIASHFPPRCTKCANSKMCLWQLHALLKNRLFLYLFSWKFH